MNTLVVVNQASSNSVEVGNYYCERRQVPPENLLRVQWSGSNLAWTYLDFQTVLLNPLLDLIASRGLSGQINYVVLSMDIPFQTLYDGVVNGTTSVMFYGPKTETGPAWVGVTNSYSGSERVFETARPQSAPGYSFLTTMVTGRSVPLAKKLIDQGTASDGTFPWQPVYLQKSSDERRNFRYWSFDNAIFNARLGRQYSLIRTNCDSPWGQTNLLGIQTGLYQFKLSPNVFVPGAMADSLTSFGGVILGPNDHTTLMAFLEAGASGSYGTVTEPSPVARKFPDPMTYFYQARGFTIAESYYQSLDEPYEGLVVADPLAAPFRRVANGRWTNRATNNILAGIASLSMQWSATDPAHPLDRVDLFIDGKLDRPLTNSAPSAGNLLTLKINGYPITYSVESNATVPTITLGLAAAINAADLPGLPRCSATAFGDRIELQIPTNFAAPFLYLDSASPTAPFRFYRTVTLAEAPGGTITMGQREPNGLYSLHAELPNGQDFSIQASTNLFDWTTVASNLSGPTDFYDTEAPLLPQRFYRLASTLLDLNPAIAALGPAPGGFRLQLHSPPGACLIEASTDLAQWSSIATNLAGGNAIIVDAEAVNYPVRFYRASRFIQPSIPPRLAVAPLTPDGVTSLRIDSSTRPYILQTSTDFIHWTPVFTNKTPSLIQVSTVVSAGTAASQNVKLTESRNTFLDSTAQGLRKFYLNGSLNLGSWARFTVTRTDGVTVSLAVTNQSLSATIYDLAQTLVTSINSSPDLADANGVEAADLMQGWFGSAFFNVRARSPGLAAASAQVLLEVSSGMIANPDLAVLLNQNLTDLNPRNHVYVSAGQSSMVHSFSLDTTQLSDGFHELTAVAYEGTSVHTQSRISLPVVVVNSNLNATLSVLDGPATNFPASGICQLAVAANANNVTATRLFTSGGLWNTVSNQPNAVFTLDGAVLGPGLHPVYAIVETSDGRAYRTVPRLIRFVTP